MQPMVIGKQIHSQYQRVLDQIAHSARSAGRDPADVRLVVVTKGQPLEAVQEVIAAGARNLGENYVEEAAPKIRACVEQTQVNWHMIGHVQSRKARPVCENFDWLHSLDSLKLAQRLDRFAGELRRTLTVLLECNISGEQTKFGFPAWEEQDWPRILPAVEHILALPNLKVNGLMTMAPFLPDAEQTRPYFNRLRQLQEFLAAEFSQADWRELSMGMSADFKVAVQEGATLVRIGTAIMGPRPTQ